MSVQYPVNNRAVSRILKEVREMSKIKSTLFTAHPMENDIFEWHFTIRGPRGTDFDGGIYHGKIVLPSEYPHKPPDIVFLTPNGRFEVGKKVCLTISSHHAESWQPSWGIRTALLAIIAFMPSRGDGAIASLDWSPNERKKLAKQSLGWSCTTCGSHNITALPPEDVDEEVDSREIEGITIKNKEQETRDNQITQQTAQGQETVEKDDVPAVPTVPALTQPVYPKLVHDKTVGSACLDILILVLFSLVLVLAWHKLA
eukprot:TRINITY_DN5178_c0_g2_i10.p1 TRINITY_DN5178_c0_g2~~TRINITY_DN5178_c0_g2_i10.p1  ORF type:complete len:257 (+),score=41.49 TRINITY_DN5178_c0_g2_i10:116-886(+)